MDVINTGNAYQRAKAIPSLAGIADPRVVPALIDLLKDEAAPVRSYAAQQLARLADKRSIEALSEALNDPYYNVRMYAARGLEKMGREEHVPALVAAVMRNLPPKSDEYYYGTSSLSAKLQAISKLSSKAPPPIVGLLRWVSANKKIGKNWWLYEEIARCLGQIGDKAAYKELWRAKKSLEKDHQDYKTWYAVRNALAALNPQKMAFDRPAADILESVRIFKISWEGIQQKWVRPLVELGGEVVGDLDWVLRFESERDRERKRVALEALGEIGGTSAAEVLRRYIRRVSDSIKINPKASRQYRYPLRKAMLALLKADPKKETVEDIVVPLQALDSFDQEYLMHDVSSATPGKIPAEISMLLYKEVLLDTKQTKSLGRYTPSTAAKLLGQMGGEKAGTVLSQVLLKQTNIRARDAAARALGIIKGYDAVPTLIKVSKFTNAPVGIIAEAMGKINDKRVVPALEDMSVREKLSETARLWIAAALARFGEDYKHNAAIVRQALPSSLEQAKWLHDTETINAVAAIIEDEGYAGQRVISTLEAISTKEAFGVLSGSINLEATIKPRQLQHLSAAAARMAGKLGIDSQNYYADIAEVSKAVPGWFEIQQVARPQPDVRASHEAVKRHVALARKLWIMEAARRLDLAAKQQDRENWKSNIPEQAIRAVEDIFAPELVPVLERIAKESRDKVSFHGKYRMVEFYNVRSLAAKILTEKTGQVHTFLDADGRSHLGGWNPSQEK